MALPPLGRPGVRIRVLLAAVLAASTLLALPSHRISIYYSGGFRDRAPLPPLLDAVRASAMLEQIRAHLSRCGRPVLTVDTDDRRVTVGEAGGLRLAFVPAGEDGVDAVRRARREHPADLYVLLAYARHLRRLSGCGADAVIPATMADDVSAEHLTHLADGTPVAPFVDGRHNLGCLQVEERGLLLRRRVFHAHVVAQAWRLVDPRAGHAPQDAAAGLILGYGAAGLRHDLAYFRESPMGDYVADVMRESTGADVALVNHLAMRNGLEGPVGREDVTRALPFDDRLATLDVRGSVLGDLMRQNAREDRAFLQFSGLRVRYTPGRPESVRTFVGESPLDEARSYRVVTIDYVLGTRRYALLRGTRLRWTGAHLRELILDDLARRRGIPLPDRRSDVAGVQPDRPVAPRPPDLSALARGDLAGASRSLAEQAARADADRGACLLFLGYADYLRGNPAGARAAWTRAARIRGLETKASTLLRLAEAQGGSGARMEPSNSASSK